MDNSKSYFERSTFIVFIFSSLGSLFNLVFQFISLKMLSVPDYGDLNALLSISTVVGTIATIASLDAVRFSSEAWINNSVSPSKKSELIYQYAKGILPVFSVIVITLGLLSFILKNSLRAIFNISNDVLIPLAVISGGISIFSSAFSGILQGMQRFVASSLVNNIIFLIKLVLSILLFMLGLSVSGAFISLLIGYIVSFFASFILVKNTISNTQYDSSSLFSVKKYLHSLSGIFAAQLALSLISNIDIQVVKLYFDKDVSGIYSSAMVVGKISNYVISALIFVLLPIASANASGSAESQRVLIKTFIYTGLVTILFALVCTPLYHYFALPILGTTYSPSEEFIFPIALLFVPVSLISVFVTYAIARQKTGFVSAVIYIGIIAFLILSFYHHNSVRQVLFLQTGVFSIVSAVLVIKLIVDEQAANKEGA